MVGFLRFLYAGQIGTWSKMWSFEVVFFLIFTLFSCLSAIVVFFWVFLIHFVFYTPGSLVKDSLEVSYYLDYSSFPYLHESGTWFTVTTNNMGGLTQGQSCSSATACLCEGLTLSFYVYFQLRVETGWKIYQCSPNLDFNDFMVVRIISGLFKETKFHIRK